MSAYDDSASGLINNNPKLRVADWSRQWFGLDVENPQSQNFVIPPNSSLTLFDGTRSIAVDGTTVFSITNTQGSTYQVIATSGTAPGFRTARSLNTSDTTTFSVSINNNSIVSFTQTSGASVTFTSVQVGDILYIAPGSLFNAGNKGFFPIVAKGANYVQIQNTSAVAESNISLTTGYATNFQIFSSSGVQVGDTVKMSIGFSPVTLGTYQVTAVAPTFFEFLSSNPLPLETGIQPTASGLAFYNNSKFMTYLEVDQNCYLNFDGDTSNSNTVEPFDASSGVDGVFIKFGSNYRGVLTNRSLLNSCSVYFFSAEL